MYKVNRTTKSLTHLAPRRFGDLGVFERSDVQEWIEKTPDLLGEPLLVLAKEFILPSGIRLDLLALDKVGSIVVVELKRDASATRLRSRHQVHSPAVLR